MKLKNSLLSLLLCLMMSSTAGAQQHSKILNGFNLENFPDISFIFHSQNPDTLSKSDFFLLKEGGEAREFKVKRKPGKNEIIPQTTLILWEDMAYNGVSQFNFTKEILNGFFNTAEIPSSDKFAISTFNRRKNESPTLNHLTNGFISDSKTLCKSIQNHQPSSEHFVAFPNRSDLYSAISEGLEELAPIKGAKSIIVFTSGRPMKNSGAASEAQVLLKSQQLHIPIYIFQYYKTSGVAPETEGFANSTYGSFNSVKDIQRTKDSLIKLYPQMSRRYQGNDYTISFTSEAKRGDNPRMISLLAAGEEINEQLIPPSHTLISWLRSHPIVILLFVITAIAIAVGIALFIHKTRRTQAENRRELNELENRRAIDKQQAEQYQGDIEAKQRLESEQKLQQQQREENEKLLRLMEIKSLFPRLTYQVGPRPQTFEITKPLITIGRAEESDVVLPSSGVSRHHAIIRFNGYAFEIIDQQSTNKVIVNGQIVEREILKNGDIIGLGEITLTIFI